jgi:hypothetical protein
MEYNTKIPFLFIKVDVSATGKCNGCTSRNVAQWLNSRLIIPRPRVRVKLLKIVTGERK